MNLAIIPARGGSRRIPGKNIRPFLGRPIIEYSIETALQSKLFETVIVSTDSEEIANVAAKAGASVPFFRSSKNSDDTATTAAVLVEVLGKTDGLRFSAACCIYPTAPLIRMESLERGLQILEENDFQCVFPVVPFGFSVWRGLRREGESIQPCWPENYLKRSQDLETIYHDAGQFYWFRPHDLTEQRTLMMNRTGSVLLSEMEVQDIDTESDWQLAELKYRLMHG